MTELGADEWRRVAAWAASLTDDVDPVTGRRAPSPMQRVAYESVRAAGDMQRAMDDVNEVLESDGSELAALLDEFDDR